MEEFSLQRYHSFNLFLEGNQMNDLGKICSKPMFEFIEDCREHHYELDYPKDQFTQSKLVRARVYY